MTNIGDRFKLYENAIRIIKLTGIDPSKMEAVLESSVKAEYCRIMDRAIQRAARPEEPVKEYRYTALNDWKFGAIIIGGDEFNEICLTQGLLWSLNDFFLRLSANARFCSDEGNVMFFNGCRCDWTYLGGQQAPQIRFVDYTPVNIRDSGTFLSRHIEVFPYDANRQDLVTLLIDVAIAFIIIHEQTHYEAGHLDYLKVSNQKSEKSEGGIRNSDSDDLESKIMEWEADFHAARAVIQIFCRPERLKFVPDIYPDKEKWMLRIITASLGSLFILMKKAQIYNNADRGHPDPRGRFINCLCHIWTCLMRDRPDYFEKHRLTVFDAFDDIGIASNLAMEDGPLEELVPGIYPRRFKTSMLDFLESEAQQSEVMKGMFYTLYGETSDTGNFPAESPEIWNQWFAEALELRNLQHKFYDKLEPYRTAIGMIK